MNLFSKKVFFISGLLGLIGALAVGFGEFLLQFNFEGYSTEDIYGFLAEIPSWRLKWGHILVVAFIPLYLFGYWHIFLALNYRKNIWAILTLILSIFSFMVGGIWIGSRAMLAEIIQADSTRLLNAYLEYLQPQVNVLRFLMLALSICFVIAILKKHSVYPKWMSLFNPVLILGTIFALYFLFPTVGKFLVPAAMNVTHVILFTISLLITRNRYSLHEVG